MDVDPISGDHISEYRLGLDFFFFPAVFIKDYPEAEFFLGKPCWEYWFLFTSLFQGKSAKRLIESIAFHDAHHQTWDKNELAVYGHELIRSLLSSTQHYKVRTATHSRFINILSEGDLGRIFSEVIKYTRVYLPMVHFPQSDTADVLLAYDAYIAELRTYLGDADIQMDTMLASRSWRITAPFRFLATVLRKNQ